MCDSTETENSQVNQKIQNSSNSSNEQVNDNNQNTNLNNNNTTHRSAPSSPVNNITEDNNKEGDFLNKLTLNDSPDSLRKMIEDFRIKHQSRTDTEDLTKIVQKHAFYPCPIRHRFRNSPGGKTING